MVATRLFAEVCKASHEEEREEVRRGKKERERWRQRQKQANREHTQIDRKTANAGERLCGVDCWAP